METLLKRVSYRGGIVIFEIPESWVEEHDPLGGSTFYEDCPDSGTLRLEVLSFVSNSQDREKGISNGRLELPRGFRPIGDGLLLRSHTKLVEELGEALKLYYWEIAVPVKIAAVRLVVFSYTILASQQEDAKVLSEIALLEECISSAIFSREAGIVGSYSGA